MALPRLVFVLCFLLESLCSQRGQRALTSRYTSWSPVLQSCASPPKRMMLLPTYRKEKLVTSQYCIQKCCVPVRVPMTGKFVVLPCVLRQPNDTIITFFQSDNAVDTSVAVDETYELVRVSAATGHTTVVSGLFKHTKPHHDIMCGSKGMFLLLQQCVPNTAPKHGTLTKRVLSKEYDPACPNGQVLQDHVSKMDYSGREIWTWYPADHLPCLGILNECWHFNGIFHDEEKGALVLTGLLLSGFFLVDVNTKQIKWAVAENWPEARADVLLKRCPESPLQEPWCGPIHRAMHIGHNRYLFFTNGCGNGHVKTQNKLLCAAMHCSSRFKRKSYLHIVQVFEERKCYNLIEEVPTNFQASCGRAMVTVDGLFATERGLYYPDGRLFRKHRLSLTGNAMYNAIPVNVTQNGSHAVIRLSSPLYISESVKAVLTLATRTDVVFRRQLALPSGAIVTQVEVPMPILVRAGTIALKVHIPQFGLTSQLELRTLGTGT